jgi:hypothetical protein
MRGEAGAPSEGVEFEAVIALDQLGAPVAFDPPRADEITTFRELREDTQETAVPN